MQLNQLKMLLHRKLVATAILMVMAVLSAHAVDDTDKKPDHKTGIASYYHDKFEGLKTASGDIFRQAKLTCASNVYPLGTWLMVTNVKTGKYVYVLVNDRMAPKMKRIVDLTKSAAKKLGMLSSGLAQVKVRNMGFDFEP